MQTQKFIANKRMEIYFCRSCLARQVKLISACISTEFAEYQLDTATPLSWGAKLRCQIFWDSEVTDTLGFQNISASGLVFWVTFL